MGEKFLKHHWPEALFLLSQLPSRSTCVASRNLEPGESRAGIQNQPCQCEEFKVFDQDNIKSRPRTQELLPSKVWEVGMYH